MLEQQQEVFPVPPDISRKFFLPECPVGSGGRGKPATLMLVPEAALYKDDRTETGEHDVRPAGEFPHVQPISQTGAVECPSQRQLRTCMLAPDSRHHSGPCRLVDNVGHVTFLPGVARQDEG